MSAWPLPLDEQHHRPGGARQGSDCRCTTRHPPRSEVRHGRWPPLRAGTAPRPPRWRLARMAFPARDGVRGRGHGPRQGRPNGSRLLIDQNWPLAAGCPAPARGGRVKGAEPFRFRRSRPLTLPSTRACGLIETAIRWGDPRAIRWGGPSQRWHSASSMVASTHRAGVTAPRWGSARVTSSDRGGFGMGAGGHHVSGMHHSSKVVLGTGPGRRYPPARLHGLAIEPRRCAARAILRAARKRGAQAAAMVPR